jgi:hypothetical protein
MTKELIQSKNTPAAESLITETVLSPVQPYRTIAEGSPTEEYACSLYNPNDAKGASRMCCGCWRIYPTHSAHGRLPTRAEMDGIQHDQLFAVVTRRSTTVQRAVESAVWWGLWVAVLATFLLVAATYHHIPMRTFLGTNRIVWGVVAGVWVVFTVSSQVMWVDEWGARAQIGFVAAAVGVHSAVLSVLCAVLVSRVVVFVVVFFLYLLTAHALWSLRPCTGSDYGCSYGLTLCLAVCLLVSVIVLPFRMAHNTHYTYRYASWAAWAAPPSAVFEALLGALLATMQMIWVLAVYNRLTHQHEASQTWYFVGRTYLVVVHGWQLVWYALTWRGCRGWRGWRGAATLAS